MFNTRKIATIGLSFIISATALFGCGSSDKSAAKEAAEGFMEAIKTDDQDAVNKWSNDEVASGYFVSLFDAEYLEEQLLSSLGNPTLEDSTISKMDEFYAKYASMMEEYHVTEITMNDDGTATAYVTMTNSFPFDVVTSEETSAKFSEASAAYNEENKDELQKISDEEGSEAAVAKACNDLIQIAIDTYEDAISSSESITYKLALTLQKNEETAQWYVSSVQSYDSSIAGTGTPATKTTTPPDADTTAADAGASSASTDVSTEASESTSN